ncbi:pyridoxamine 5'-phosphate oxidase family protein [Pseudonocardia sp. RS11V-5]|uniref:pyridoxamine 5'-phosphate oxidase family protein n=1 Tax=Pseudonocardia terrae TaxID=2905831 RepID=UPI001E40678B|nr:pyridoxamine 5'-phosphate oxidase family protein [Pseudonocardia terrae]MCE3550470.1 pyridoxamine 5'-phosphate oxidase family protein [Pseudonocardia terrae]
MTRTLEPVTEFDGRYSEPAAQPTPWGTARARLADAPLYWVSTIRPGGRRPHVTPLIGVWHEGALHFCTGAGERKARNLAQNRGCVVTTGCNDLDRGLDVVVEGEAVRVTNLAALHDVADAYVAKYGEEWHFDVTGDDTDGAFVGDGGPALVFAVAPEAVWAFAKGTYGQTRYRF